MNPLLDFKIRFSDAAYAIESTPKALRNWIQKGQVTLVSEDTIGWREFSLAEIAILAVIRRLVNFGMKVEEANQLANDAARSLFEYEKISAKTFKLAIRPVSMLVWRDPEWKMKLLERDEPLPDGLDTFLVIKLNRVYERIFERVFRRASDTKVGGDGKESD